MTLANKSVSVTLNGTKYVIMPHPATEALKLVRLLASHLKLGDLKINLDAEVGLGNLGLIANIANAFCQHSIDNDPNFTLLQELFKHTQIVKNGTQTYVMNQFDDHFAANWQELISLVGEVIKVNNFLPMLNSIGSQSAQPKAQPEPMGS